MVLAHGSHLQKQATRARQTPTADAAPYIRSDPDIDLAARKAALRKLAAGRRAEAHVDGAAAAERLREIGLAALGDRVFGVVSGYWPIRTEIDPHPLMLALAARGAALALPCVIGPGPLAFRLWRPDETLAPGRHGIAEPGADSPIVEPDLLLVPLLAFDVERHRLGYGAAHYDATIAALKRRKAIFTVGLAYAAQAVDAVPLEPWDETLDLIVTDQGLV